MQNKSKHTKRLDTRTIISMVFTLILMPAAVLLMWKLGGKSYYVGSVVMIVLSLVPFFLSFEGRRPDARELVVIAVLSALATASRAAFAAVPHFKPIIAIIMIAGISFGAQAGFLTGAISALASNIFFGQGPWTPWQMLAYGMAGFIAGLLAYIGIIDGKKRIPTCIAAVFIVMLLVGPILDTSSVFMMLSLPTAGSASAIYLSGIPVNAVLSASTVITLFLISKPMTEKLDRVKLKYGMMAGKD